MFKRWVWVVALGALMVGCAHSGARDKRGEPPAEARYLPPELDGVALGMSKSDFQALRPVGAEEAFTDLDFRVVLVEEEPYETIEALVYYFDADLPEQPLYEIIAQYPAGVDVVALARQRFGEPNHPSEPGEWQFKGAPWLINAWVYQQKVVVAAAMPGTEWDPADQ